MADELVHVLERDTAQVVLAEVVDRMDELDAGVPGHALAPVLVLQRVAERGRDDDGGRDPALLELDGGVHTAHRAGPSPTQGADDHVALARHLLYGLERGRL